MTWSYSGNPAESSKDAVRFLVGDTDRERPILQNEEILWVLSQYNNAPINAAIRCCETIIAKFTRLVDESVGAVRMSYSQRAKAFNTTLTMLRSRLAMEDASPYAGGISISDSQAVAANTDRSRPFFTRHMMEDWIVSPWIMADSVTLFQNSGE